MLELTSTSPKKKGLLSQETGIGVKLVPDSAQGKPTSCLASQPITAAELCGWTGTENLPSAHQRVIHAQLAAEPGASSALAELCE